MFLLIVYDTEKKNCVKLHKSLKKYLFWNQNSVFEGTVSRAQYEEIKYILREKCVPKSHIVLYSMENEKLITKEEIGEGKGNTDNIL